MKENGLARITKSVCVSVLMMFFISGISLSTAWGQCAPACENAWVGDEDCDPECNVASCNFDGGDCVICAPGCPHTWVGDEECDPECNVALCNFDGGDCSPPCPLELIYGEHSKQTGRLRSFRDNIISQTPEGKEIIKLYYQLSPVVVEAMQADEAFKQDVKEMIDSVLPMIEKELD